MHTHIHEHPLLRRMTASLTGAVIALTVHGIYQDTTAAIIGLQKQHQTVVTDDAARVHAFAEALKAQRAAISQ